MRGLNVERQALKDYDREWGLKSTYYLAKVLLGYTKFNPVPNMDTCRFVDDPTHKGKILLEPRGTFKTCIASQAYVTRLILNNPNIRVLLASVVLSNSSGNLTVIENHLERPNIKFVFGDHEGGRITWSSEVFKSALRTDGNLKEPTVRAIGMGKVEIGPHYDVIILDDLHDRDNVKTREQIEAVKQFIKLVVGGLLEPGGIVYLVGTRWGYADAISMVLGETEDKDELEIAKLFTAKRIKGPYNEDGSLYAPTILTPEVIAFKRASFGKRLYNAMILNDPVPLDDPDATFSQRFFNRYTELPV